ncbi:MAG: ZIP family metal transporter [Pseudomonadota bacterium]
MEFPIPIAIFAATGAAAVTALGLVCVWLNAEWTRKNAGLFAAFAAGALTSVVLLHLAPEALGANSFASQWMLAGFFGGFLLNRGVLAWGGEDSALTAGLTPALAIAAHSFVDGVVYAVTFSVSETTGFLTVVGLILHEAPEGVIVFTLLQRSGFNTRKALVYAFLAAGLTTPLGAVTAYPVIGAITPELLGAVFAATSGLLLYIAAAHLIPHVEREPMRRAVPALAVGVAVAAGAMLAHGPAHNHHHGHEHLDPHAGHQHFESFAGAHESDADH